MHDYPETFGRISHSLIKNLTSFKTSKVYIVFDTYSKPSIKDYKHKLRNNLRERDYAIEGPESERPAKFVDELKNIKFQQAFINFFIKNWRSPVHNSLFKANQSIYVSYDKCYKFRKVADEIKIDVIDELSCTNHEEAHTKMVFHACSMAAGSMILIKCSDTDVLVILLSNLKYLLQPERQNINKKIWMQLGTGKNVRNIDVCSTFSALGEKLSSS